MDFLTQFSIDHPWLPLAISTYLLLIKILTGIKDAIDKQKSVDTNWFEKLVTILIKTTAYMTLGQRPQAPASVVESVGVVANATGVKVAEIASVDAGIKIEAVTSVNMK